MEEKEERRKIRGRERKRWKKRWKSGGKEEEDDIVEFYEVSERRGNVAVLFLRRRFTR